MATFDIRRIGQFRKTLRKCDELAVEATGNTAWFVEQISDRVSRVVVVDPHQFKVIRKSVKKTDKHDVRTLALFLSKDMLPEARMKSKENAQLHSLAGTRAKRYSPYLRRYYEHIKRHRGSGKAIIATARKLLGIIYQTLKNDWIFEDFPNFVIANT